MLNPRWLWTSWTLKIISARMQFALPYTSYIVYALFLYFWYLLKLDPTTKIYAELSYYKVQLELALRIVCW